MKGYKGQESPAAASITVQEKRERSEMLASRGAEQL